ncbi:MAG: hypothetical protein Q8P28_07340 [Deltaproteobacteria bacterium]|nr:hypothetical protein [Deltaproteobacteria bacterium]
MSMANPMTSPIQIRQTRTSFSSLCLALSIFAWFDVTRPDAKHFYITIAFLSDFRLDK